MATHLLTLWDILVSVFSLFFFIAYLFILFQVVSDLFRDQEASGLYKAAWIVFLLFIPLLTSLIYLIVRGKGMAERHRAQVQNSSQRLTSIFVRWRRNRPLSRYQMPKSC